jgi:hypothetical protein
MLFEAGAIPEIDSNHTRSQLSIQPTAVRTPPIGILIPTYNRISNLLKTLEHLELQTWKEFEVIIVNDGSTDDTLTQLDRYRQTAPFSLVVETQINSGPAAARNRGIRLMRAPLTLIIGDDTYPVRDFVRIHLQHHIDFPALQNVALGYTRYSEKDQFVTAFMRWLNSDGVQFAYGPLLSGTPPDWRHFYTSNLSVKTAYLREHPFHEAFRKAAVEDLELGYRLFRQHGLQMAFLPDAIADHVHPVNFHQTCKRAVDVGENLFKMGELWPEHPSPALKGYTQTFLAVLTKGWVWSLIVRLVDGITWLRPPGRFLHSVVEFHRMKGYYRAAEAAKATSRH